MSRFLFLLFLFLPQSQPLRQFFANNGIVNPIGIPRDLLDMSFVEVKRNDRYIHLSSHLSPSAELLLVLTPEMRLVGRIGGWERATLPGDLLLYQRNQVHFAPTHRLEIAVYDPKIGTDRTIYPPTQNAPIREQFISRVAEAYRQRGEDWFRENNHHMDPTLFDSSIQGDVIVDRQANAFSFDVRYGDPENARDPLLFTQDVHVTCSPLAPIERIECRETAAR